MKRSTVLVVLLLAVTGSIAGSTSAADAAPVTTARLQALNNDILIGLNATRSSHGLRPLVLSANLQRSAATHSRSMLDGGFFEHQSRDGSSFATRLKRFYRSAGYDTWSVGENLLYSTSEIDATSAIEAWLNSPAHRENMLNPTWREVGIGSLSASTAGGIFGGEATWLITVDFGTRSASRSRKLAAPKP